MRAYFVGGPGSGVHLFASVRPPWGGPGRGAVDVTSLCFLRLISLWVVLAIIGGQYSPLARVAAGCKQLVEGLRKGPGLMFGSLADIFGCCELWHWCGGELSGGGDPQDLLGCPRLAGFLWPPQVGIGTLTLAVDLSV